MTAALAAAAVGSDLMNGRYPPRTAFIPRSCGTLHAARDIPSKRGHVMKFRQTVSLNLLCMAAFGFAAVAANAQTPPTSDQAKKDMSAQKKDPLAIQGSGGENWDSIKGHEKGYVAKEDAMPNSWLAVNFANCDKDQDGKVTEMEYTKCQTPMR
jgi:hypothetical protein